MLDYEEALTRCLALPPALQPPSVSTTPVIPGTPVMSRDGASLPSSRSSSRKPGLGGSTSSPRGAAHEELTGHYNTSAHFLWIGDRTRQLNGAHIEYFRGIRNPIGVKVGPSMDPAELVRLIESMFLFGRRTSILCIPVLNPDREAGRLTLITRYGAGKVCQDKRNNNSILNTP